MKGSAWKLFVLALVVMIVAAALVVPVVAGAVARVGDGSTAAQCQSGHSCGGAPVAAMCQSGYCVRWATGRGLAAAGYERHVSERGGLRRLIRLSRWGRRALGRGMIQDR